MRREDSFFDEHGKSFQRICESQKIKQITID
jgi:hypothetical protein